MFLKLNEGDDSLKKSRGFNLINNVIVGYVVQMGIFLLTFITRKVFITYLSIDYLGINGLYSNLLTLLSLAELGLGNAAVYSLYKPVSENDEDKINCLVRFYKKLYLILSILILVLGLLLIPFLHLIINSSLTNSQLIIYYIIFLLSTVMSYLCAHNIVLLNANQNFSTQKIITMIVSVFQNIFQILALIIWKNYIVYILIQLLSNIIISILTNCYTVRKYKFLKKKITSNLINKKDIYSNIISICTYKLGAVLVSNTDNILISIIVGTSVVGFYSNYNMVITAINTFIAIITNSLVYGIGNLCAEETKEKKLQTFNNILFIYNLIGTFCSITLFLCLNEFIKIWIGNQFIFENTIVFVICFNFYLTNINNPIWMFREATGMFKNVKYIMLATATINITLSIIMGKIYGLFGILIATIISKLLTIYVYEPIILFKKQFNEKSTKYFKKQFIYFRDSLICIALCFFVSLFIGHGILLLFLKVICFFLIVLFVFFIFHKNSSEWIYMKNFINKIRRKKKKVTLTNY